LSPRRHRQLAPNRDVHHRIEHPVTVEAAELDRYLREGWYRMGQTMITCRFVVSGEQARGVLWTRTRLDGYVFSRSNRRLMRKNRRRYRIHEEPLVIDDEHEALYQRYLEVAPGARSATLLRSLMGNDAVDRFATREIALRDEDGQLVAFSAFDVGVDSLQSLMGVYDPAHRSQSLGYWSLLLEVEHALKLGLRYHYSGYVVPQSSEMAYKLRVGHMEFLDPDDGRWRPWEHIHSIETPSERLERVLTSARDALVARGVYAQIENYRWFEAPAWSPALSSLLAEPRVVVLGDASLSPITVVVWNFDEQRYALLLCTRVMVGSASASGEDQIEMWLTHDRVMLGDDPHDMAHAVGRWWTSPNRITHG
jgi:arginine-tRNA-protein transferase